MGQRIIEVRTRVQTGPSWQHETLAEYTITAPADTGASAMAASVQLAIESVVADTNKLHGYEPLEEPGAPS